MPAAGVVGYVTMLRSTGATSLYIIISVTADGMAMLRSVMLTRPVTGVVGYVTMLRSAGATSPYIIMAVNCVWVAIAAFVALKAEFRCVLETGAELPSQTWYMQAAPC